MAGADNNKRISLVSFIVHTRHILELLMCVMLPFKTGNSERFYPFTHARSQSHATGRRLKKKALW